MFKRIHLYLYLIFSSFLYGQSPDLKFGKNGLFSLYLENDSLYSLVKYDSTGIGDIFIGIYTVEGNRLSLKSDSSIRVVSGYSICDTNDVLSGLNDSILVSTTLACVELSESMHCKSLLYKINGIEYLYEARDPNQFDNHPIKIPKNEEHDFDIYFPEYDFSIVANCPENTSSISISLFYRRSTQNIFTYSGIPEKFKIGKKEFVIRIIE
jgi:hypothetical protein